MDDFFTLSQKRYPKKSSNPNPILPIHLIQKKVVSGRREALLLILVNIWAL